MTSSGLRLLIATLLMPISIMLMTITEWFGILFLVAFICTILLSLDYARALRELNHKSRFQKIMSATLLVPQILFGLVSLILGSIIAVWVLYNTFVARQPEYTGGILTFGVAPALIIYGVASLKGIFFAKEHEEN